MIFQNEIQARLTSVFVLVAMLLLSGCIGVDGQPILLLPMQSAEGPATETSSANTTADASTDTSATDATTNAEDAETSGDDISSNDTSQAQADGETPDPSGIELGEEVRVDAGHYLFQPIAGSAVEISGETVEARGPSVLPNGFTPLELYLTGARITAENSPLNAMPLQTVFQVIMGDILMDGAQMGPPFEITLRDAPGMAADFTAPPPRSGQSEVSGRVLMIVDATQIFMMMGLGPVAEWESSGSVQFQRILETVRFLDEN